ncbi:MAG: FlgB family protein [Halocynthiibacter sp.]
MFDNLEIFRMAYGLASHASARLSVIANNVAQADTPGYRSKDIPPFAETYQSQSQSTQMRATRPGHLAAAAAGASEIRLIDAGDENSPNGNSVSLETEMMKASEVRYQHELALSIYSTSLNILRTSVGRR